MVNLNSYISAAEEFSFSVYHFINFFDVEGYVLHVIAAFDAAVGVDGFGNCAGAQGHDGLVFLHVEEGANSLVALGGIAYIFKIAGHVLLAVEIIGLHVHTGGALCCYFHGFVRIMKGLNAVFFYPEAES